MSAAKAKATRASAKPARGDATVIRACIEAATNLAAHYAAMRTDPSGNSDYTNENRFYEKFKEAIIPATAPVKTLHGVDAKARLVGPVLDDACEFELPEESWAFIKSAAHDTVAYFEAEAMKEALASRDGNVTPFVPLPRSTEPGAGA
jgi:hypothetical protein